MEKSGQPHKNSHEQIIYFLYLCMFWEEVGKISFELVAVQFFLKVITEPQLCLCTWQERKPLRKRRSCNLYVYKCQNVKACNPFKRW